MSDIIKFPHNRTSAGRSEAAAKQAADAVMFGHSPFVLGPTSLSGVSDSVTFTIDDLAGTVDSSSVSHRLRRIKDHVRAHGDQATVDTVNQALDELLHQLEGRPSND
jgi:hypothetical protein